MAEQLVPIFNASDAAETAKWYARLGFELESEHRFAPNMPMHSLREATFDFICPSTKATRRQIHSPIFTSTTWIASLRNLLSK